MGKEIGGRGLDLDELVKEGAESLSTVGPQHSTTITDALQESASSLARVTLQLRAHDEQGAGTLQIARSHLTEAENAAGEAAAEEDNQAANLATATLRWRRETARIIAAKHTSEFGENGQTQLDAKSIPYWQEMLRKEGVRLYGWKCATNVVSIASMLLVDDGLSRSPSMADISRPCAPWRNSSVGLSFHKSAKRLRGGRPVTGNSKASLEEAKPEPPAEPENPTVCEVGEWEGVEIVRRRLRKEGEAGRKRHSLDTEVTSKSSKKIDERIGAIITKGEHLAKALKTFEATVTAKLMKRIDELEARVAAMALEFQRWKVLMCVVLVCLPCHTVIQLACVCAGHGR
jgi:hypothetical protein